MQEGTSGQTGISDRSGEHWQYLSHTKSPSSDQSAKFHNVMPPTKDIRVQLEKLQPGSPPLTQAIYNDRGQLVGTRTFSKYSEGYAQSECEMTAKLSSAISPLVSPFSREKKTYEWGSDQKSSEDTDDNQLEQPPSVASISSATSPGGSCSQLHLHLDSSPSPHTSSTITKVKSKAVDPTVSDEVQTTHEQGENVGIVATPSEKKDETDCHSISSKDDSPTSSDAVEPIMRSRPTRKTARNLAAQIKAEVEHIDKIHDILTSDAKMSNSQFIATLDKLNLKSDMIAEGTETFYIAVVKQLHIGSIGQKIRSSDELRKMISHHMVYEDDYYKLVADTFLCDRKQTLEDFCARVETSGNPISALDVFATARAVDCRFRLVGVDKEWSNSFIEKSLEHRNVCVTMIVYAPGEICSTKPDFGKPSLRKKVTDVLKLTKVRSDSGHVKRMTLDVLSAPMAADAPVASTSSGMQSEEGRLPASKLHSEVTRSEFPESPVKSSNFRDASVHSEEASDKLTDDLSKSTTHKPSKAQASVVKTGSKNKTIVGKSQVSSKSPRGRPPKPKEDLSPKRKSTSSGRKRDNNSDTDSPPCGRKKLRSAVRMRAEVTPRRVSPRCHNTSQELVIGRKRTEPSASKASKDDGTKQKLKTSTSPRTKKQNQSQSPIVSSPQNPREVTPSTHHTLTPSSRQHSNAQLTITSSSSEETDFSALDVDKLSPKDTKYFLTRTVGVINKLRGKLSRARSRKGKRASGTSGSTCLFTPTGTPINRPQPSATTSATSPTAPPQEDDTSWFVCPTCKRIFSSKPALEQHRQQHHARRYACKDCTKSYSHFSTLCNHRLTHKHKFFTCEECKKSFTRKDRLREHVLAHSGEYKFLCVTCGKGYNRKGQYEDHVRRHSKVKAHKCSKCSNSFYYRQDLLRHSRDTCPANPQPKVPCDVCGKTYKTTKSMLTHRKKHTGFEKFICSKCNKVFVSSYGYKTHMDRCQGKGPRKQ